jgi:hypothetical protein
MRWSGLIHEEIQYFITSIKKSRDQPHLYIFLSNLLLWLKDAPPLGKNTLDRIS